MGFFKKTSDPEPPFDYVQRGQACFNNGDYDQAIADLTEGLRVSRKRLCPATLIGASPMSAKARTSRRSRT